MGGHTAPHRRKLAYQDHATLTTKYPAIRLNRLTLGCRNYHKDLIKVKFFLFVLDSRCLDPIFCRLL